MKKICFYSVTWAFLYTFLAIFLLKIEYFYNEEKFAKNKEIYQGKLDQTIF